MKYSGAAFSVFLVDGYNLAASTSEAVDVETESITEQTNGFGVGNKSSSPMGLEQGAFSVGNGFFDAVTDALHSAIGAVTGVPRVVCAAIFGNIIGKPFIGFEGMYSQKYKVIDKPDGLTMADVSYLVSGEVEEGVIVQNLALFSADWDTKTGGAGVTDAPVDYTADPANRQIAITSNTLANPTVVTSTKPHGLTSGQKILISGSNSTPSINGVQIVTVTGPSTFTVPVNVTIAGTAGSFVLAATTAGGSGYLQATQYAGYTNVVVKIMHSPDDITYAALITFTALTAIGKERKTVAGTVDRFLSSAGTGTGAGNITPFTGFSRN